MKKHKLTTTHIIMMGFLAGIVLGTICLALPISTREGQDVNLIDALFVSVSSICVTGLSTVNIGQTFSLFGQIVILLLIQFGGLGIVTFTTLVLLLFHRRITLSERLLIQNAYNLDSLSGLIKLTVRIFKVTLCIEGLGAIGYSFVFVPEYGLKGIWYSIFHAVSAFCNAGIDLLGGNSFCGYSHNVILNVVTIMLIIVSGLGFPVYWEIVRVAKYKIKGTRSGNEPKLNIQVKLVFVTTAVLILVGFAATLLFEYHNPDTLGDFSLKDKIMASLFQSVTLRTAGFSTIDQSFFSDESCLVYIVLMFIGGSPAGTAGGVKTVTIALLFASLIANIKGEEHVTVFRRKIADSVIRRCVAIVLFSLSVLIVLSVALIYVQDGNFLDVCYEMTSAIATVGLSRGLTGGLNDIGKIIVALTMYLGRIGPITLPLAFYSKNIRKEVSYGESKVIIG